jgi:hypothetical protein
MLSAEQLADLDRFFTCIKSINELDNLEIKNVVHGILGPKPREVCVTLNYDRATLNIELVLTILQTKQFQAIAMIARMMLETAIELKLIANDPNAVAKVLLFGEVEKLKSARKVVDFVKANSNSNIEWRGYKAFIDLNEQRITQAKANMWSGPVKHWTQKNVENRVKHLGSPYDELYQAHYSQLSWYVHSGVTGVLNVTGDTLGLFCGVAFKIIMESYALILESVIDEFNLQKHDPQLKKKILLTKMLPFTNSPREQEGLTRHLLGRFPA